MNKSVSVMMLSSVLTLIISFTLSQTSVYSTGESCNTESNTGHRRWKGNNDSIFKDNCYTPHLLSRLIVYYTNRPYNAIKRVIQAFADEFLYRPIPFHHYTSFTSLGLYTTHTACTLPYREEYYSYTSAHTTVFTFRGLHSEWTFCTRSTAFIYINT